MKTRNSLHACSPEAKMKVFQEGPLTAEVEIIDQSRKKITDMHASTSHVLEKTTVHSHGVKLLAQCEACGECVANKHTDVFQYMFIEEEISMAMSPLSNHLLFWRDWGPSTEKATAETVPERVDTTKRGRGYHPLKTLLSRGVRLTLSTDDPTVFHATHD